MVFLGAASKSEKHFTVKKSSRKTEIPYSYSLGVFYFYFFFFFLLVSKLYICIFITVILVVGDTLLDSCYSYMILLNFLSLSINHQQVNLGLITLVICELSILFV
jgi:hypothetical protein